MGVSGLDENVCLIQIDDSLTMRGMRDRRDEVCHISRYDKAM